MKFLLDDPGESYKVFSIELDAVAAAISAIADYRAECADSGEWPASVAGIAIYSMPDGVTVDDCAEIGIGESGCRLLWQAVENGNDAEGYDYEMKRTEAK